MICLPVMYYCTVTTCVYFLVSPPDIVSHPNPSAVDFYSSVQFSCVARGFELKTINWKKADSQRLPVTATVTNTSSNINEIVSVLTITKVIGYYSGQYFCEAKNSAGTTMSSPASLNVNGMYVASMYACSYMTQLHCMHHRH